MWQLIKRLLLISCVINSATATVYQWQDEEGVTVFSDQPHKGAKAVSLPKIQTFSHATLALPEASKPAPPMAKKIIHPTYRELRFTHLANQATIRNNNAIPVTLQASVQPSLQIGAEAVLLVDGKPMVTLTGPQAQLAFKLQGVERGEHRLQLKVVASKSQKTLAQSAELTIYFQQNSVRRAK